MVCHASLEWSATGIEYCLEREEEHGCSEIEQRPALYDTDKRAAAPNIEIQGALSNVISGYYQ